MNHIDIFIIILIAIFGLIGFKTGLLKSVFSFIGIIAGLFFASKFYDKLAAYFSKFGWFDIATSIVSFISIVLLFYFIASYIAGKISNSHSITSSIDKVLGAAFGVFQALLISSVILIIINKTEFISPEVMGKSYSNKHIKNFSPMIFNFIGKSIPFTKPYVKELFFIK